MQRCLTRRGHLWCAPTARFVLALHLIPLVVHDAGALRTQSVERSAQNSSKSKPSCSLKKEATVAMSATSAGRPLRMSALVGLNEKQTRSSCCSTSRCAATAARRADVDEFLHSVRDVRGPGGPGRHAPTDAPSFPLLRPTDYRIVKGVDPSAALCAQCSSACEGLALLTTCEIFSCE